MSEPGPVLVVPPNRVGSTRLVAGLVVLVALLTGVVLGVVLGRTMGPPWGRGHGGFGGRPGGPGFSWGPRGPSAEDRRAMRQRFDHELNLTPAQSARVDSIMKRRMAAFDSLRQEMQPRMRRMMDSTRAQIDSVLTPEQRTKFHDMEQRRMRGPGRGHDRDDGPGAPGGGPPQGGGAPPPE
jgi:Spy/CpxP family protein refolding chaperone